MFTIYQPIGSIGSQENSETLKCASCSKQCIRSESCCVIGKIFHKSCFKCKECKIQLNEENYKAYKNEIYCAEHYSMKQSQVEQKFDLQLECIICFGEYGTEKDIQPLQLDCGHIFHRKCLNELQSHSQKEKGTSTFPCPDCRKLHNRTVDGLSPCYELLNVLAQVKQMEEKQAHMRTELEIEFAKKTGNGSSNKIPLYK
ncbi:MAG: hypothetical protein Satyrvirus43_8 [Satyrvirus sp.]|uniref:RING-type domain-containing protein n=1 Tax=Satyrvirus sp. TaxID=2487771 RepID=A0A3G5AGT2_9VIRU|nr:MAG: hypothetical protein Satyrvirus43_8 [Satyrvirus sp.]